MRSLRKLNVLPGEDVISPLTEEAAAEVHAVHLGEELSVLSLCHARHAQGFFLLSSGPAGSEAQEEV